MPSLPFLISSLEFGLKKPFSSVKISDLPPSEDSNLLLSLQLETEDPGVKSNKRKKTELYCNLLHLNDTNDMEVLGFTHEKVPNFCGSSTSSSLCPRSLSCSWCRCATPRAW